MFACNFIDAPIKIVDFEKTHEQLAIQLVIHVLLVFQN